MSANLGVGPRGTVKIAYPGRPTLRNANPWGEGAEQAAPPTLPVPDFGAVLSSVASAAHPLGARPTLMSPNAAPLGPGVPVGFAGAATMLAPQGPAPAAPGGARPSPVVVKNAKLAGTMPLEPGSGAAASVLPFTPQPSALPAPPPEARILVSPDAQAASAAAIAIARGQVAPPSSAPQLGVFADGRPRSAYFLRRGDTIGPYTIVARLGEGGMSYVFEAKHGTTGAVHAVKILLEKALSRSALVARFKAEARVLQDCRQLPGVVPVYEIGDDPDLGPYIAMEKLAGHSLRATLQQLQQSNDHLDLSTCLFIVVELAETLHAIHLGGVVHRDIKPENIFLQSLGQGRVRPMLLDFGAAKSRHNASTAHDELSVVTPMYMAPEQVQPKRHSSVSAAVDQYALAHVLYEMLFEYAFAQGLRDNPGASHLAASWQLLVDPLPLPASVAPRGVSDAILRALHKDPKQRYPTMLAWADALRPYLTRADRTLGVRSEHHERAPTAPTGARAVQPQAGAGPGLSAPPSPVADPANRKRLIAPCTVLPEPSFVVLEPFRLRGQRWVLGDTGVVGRDAGAADLVVEHDTISAQHARYNFVTGDAAQPVYVIEDLDSLNGLAMASSKQAIRSDSDYVPVVGSAVAPVWTLIALGEVIGMILPAGGFAEPDLRGWIWPGQPRGLGGVSTEESVQAAALLAAAGRGPGQPWWWRGDGHDDERAKAIEFMTKYKPQRLLGWRELGEDPLDEWRTIAPKLARAETAPAWVRAEPELLMRWSESDADMHAILAERRRGMALRGLVVLLTALAIAVGGWLLLRMWGRA